METYRNTTIILTSHIDHYDHVNHARYQDILEDAQKIFLEVRGALFSDVEVKHDVRFVQRAFSVEFNLPLYLNDQIVIETSVSSIGTTSFTFHQKIMKDNTAVTEARTVYVAIDRKNSKIKLPTEFRKKIE